MSESSELSLHEISPPLIWLANVLLSHDMVPGEFAVAFRQRVGGRLVEAIDDAVGQGSLSYAIDLYDMVESLHSFIADAEPFHSIAGLISERLEELTDLPEHEISASVVDELEDLLDYLDKGFAPHVDTSLAEEIVGRMKDRDDHPPTQQPRSRPADSDVDAVAALMRRLGEA
ncbi:hypothetical protein JIG36_36400 [Actinoplanes sp. LDG1-06]|uniref:Uncharacterized protein n=1 Tax=Paractinoplanes ovalisporus TaxID=2810368 RepID=A0ABS2AMD5_9ACTN|nr:hypothetical protein [Actinoplanes ovalisporus]MBM2620996.1 hypothetical protein [Actinoplanes ovalisporus]